MAEIAKEMDQMRSVRKEVLKQLYSYMQKAKDISIDIECSSQPGSVHEGNQAKMSELKEAIKGFVTTEIEIETHNRAINALEQQTPIPSNLYRTRDNFLKNELFVPKKEDEWRKQTRYRDYCVAIWKVHNPNKPLPWESDDEIVLENQHTIITECPISKTTMKKPMKSRLCGHVYDLQNFEFLVKNKRDGRTECPMAGCKATVRISDLVEDLETQVYIENMNKKGGPSASSSSSFSISQSSLNRGANTLDITMELD